MSDNSATILALRDFIALRLRHLHPRLQRFVCPIFGADIRGIPRLIGSGLLLKVHSYSFLITAAHVLDENAHTSIYLGGKDSLIELEGTIHSIVPPQSGRRHDSLDLGFVLLSDGLAVNLISRFAFVAPGHLDVNEILKANAGYAFVGYPATRNKPRPKNKIKLGGAMFSLNAAPLEKYGELSLDPHTHIVANFNRLNLVNQEGRKTSGPDPHGMSGGGVWFVGDYSILNGAQHPKLVGIAIEWRASDRVLIGVRVSVVISMIAAAFPATKAFLQEPNRISAKVTMIDDLVFPTQ